MFLMFSTLTKACTAYINDICSLSTTIFPCFVPFYRLHTFISPKMGNAWTFFPNILVDVCYTIFFFFFIVFFQYLKWSFTYPRHIQILSLCMHAWELFKNQKNISVSLFELYVIRFFGKYESWSCIYIVFDFKPFILYCHEDDIQWAEQIINIRFYRMKLLFVNGKK